MSETRSFLQQNFIDVMGNVSTPVTVVTVLSDGVPHGTTVSAFASLSLDPPMIMLALDRGSRLLEILQKEELFGVNLLSSGQADTALRFARKGADKFDGVEWIETMGAPRIIGAAGWLACRTDKLVEGGDHTIVSAFVVAAEDVPEPPLSYHRRAFGTHRALEAHSY
ncbi:flavin reductase family protein [Arthrobacter sp. SD76]|uniref:flavin reductase family protein n=1 Tax=Arthrobacter sp. SD76 TaxID=3415007 RepID=UPI003C795124